MDNSHPSSHMLVPNADEELTKVLQDNLDRQESDKKIYFFGFLIVIGFIILIVIGVFIALIFNRKCNNDQLDDQKKDNEERTHPIFVYVKWTEHHGYDLKFSESELYDEMGWAAKARFQNTINQTGWTTLEIETDPTFPDKIQARAAGIAEGYLTKDLIYLFYLNTIEKYCDVKGRFCEEIFEFMDRNQEWSDLKIKEATLKHPYYYQLQLIRVQFDGIMKGINWHEQHEILTYRHLMMINILQDMTDLRTVFQWRKDTHNNDLLKDWEDHCTILVKVIGNRDIYTAHNTWASPNLMLRVLKRYNFSFHESSSENSSYVPARSISMSSYPGMLYSMDDFFVTSSGLMVAETTIRSFDPKLWAHVHTNDSLFTFERVMIVNRLARNGSHWAQLYLPNNMGTYNNQWVVLDYNRFEIGKDLQDGLMHVVEQMPGIMVARDETHVLRDQGYFGSYNLPYFPEIVNATNVTMMVEMYGDFFSYNNSPRANILRRDEHKVVDIETMIKLMRYNDYQNDPYSKCKKCNPPYSAVAAISSRTDLNPRNGTYPFPHMGWQLGPALDLKVTNYNMAMLQQFVAIAGPTYDPLPPFEWSKSPPDIQELTHWGMPEIFNFTPITQVWKWI